MCVTLPHAHTHTHTHTYNPRRIETRGVGKWQHRYDQKCIQAASIDKGSKDALRMMSPRIGHTCNLIRGDLILFGGSMSGRPIDNDVYVFHIRTASNDTWNRRDRDAFRGASPCPRFGHTAILKNDVEEKIFISGGCGMEMNSGRNETPSILNDIHVLDWKEKTWTTPNLKASTGPIFGHRYCHT